MCELVDYVAVEDCGRIINPMTLRGQVIGALVQGLGGAFLENLVYDEQGQFLAGSLADYLVPTASDFPNLRAVVLESHPSPINPLGAKGAGEGGIIPVGGVIANAVANALSLPRRRAARAAAQSLAPLAPGAGRAPAPVGCRCARLGQGLVSRNLEPTVVIAREGGRPSSHRTCCWTHNLQRWHRRYWMPRIRGA